MWMYFLAAAPLVWVVILISSLYNSPASKITMSNFFERCREQAVYNAIGMRANIDDLVKRRRNRFGNLIVFKVIREYSKILSALPSNQKGRVVVITGGTKGIGLEVIRSLLKCEMHVVIGKVLIYFQTLTYNKMIPIGCRKISAGESAVAEIRKAGVDTGSSVVFECDTSSIESTKKFAQKVLMTCPKVHVLINNGNYSNHILFLFDKFKTKIHNFLLSRNHVGAF
jgi:hypothetical protein